MVKVIKGPKQVQCSKCEALLEFTSKDVYDGLDFPLFKYKYIRCPCCGHQVRI